MQVSDGRLTRVLRNKTNPDSETTAPIDKRGTASAHNKTSEEQIKKVCDFINKFPSYTSHYSRSKNPNRQYLCPDLCITKMYELYKRECLKNGDVVVSQFIFRKTFNEKFNLHFRPPQIHVNDVIYSISN